MKTLIIIAVAVGLLILPFLNLDASTLNSISIMILSAGAIMNSLALRSTNLAVDAEIGELHRAINALKAEVRK